MKQEIDPSHKARRSVLRFIGPVILLIGIAFTATAFIDFIGAMNRRGEPDKFWCAFIGMPMMFFGFVMSSAGYMGTVARYVANEQAPVAKDTFNYLADGTKEGVQTVASAVATGLRTGASTPPQAHIRCHKCNEPNESTARFCKECGTALAKTKACSRCNELNDPDAKFCDECGQRLA